MSALDRKLRRDLFAARGTLMAIMLVIVVGIACFVGLGSAHQNLKRSLQTYYARCRMADFWVSLKKAPLSEVRALEELPGVAELQPRITFAATIDLEAVAQPLNGEVISLPDQPRPILNDIVLRRGAYFTDERLEEVIINDSFARARRINPGDTIHVILNNRRQELFVVGTAISSEFLYTIAPGSIVPENDNFGILWIKRTFAEDTLDMDGACNELVGRLTEPYRDSPDLVLDEIERRLDPNGVFTTTPRADQSSHLFISDEIIGLRVTAIILPAVFLAVAALILNILMTRLAEQQRTIVGTLKSLGYSNRALTRHYLKFGVAVGVLGGLAGLVFGYVMAGWLTDLYTRYYEFPRLVNRIMPGVYGVGMIISIVFALLGTLYGVRRIVAMNPAEAMRAKPPVEGGAIWLERYRVIWKRLGFRWQMVLRSIWRNRFRAAIQVFASSLGCALILVTLALTLSIREGVQFQFDLLLRSDIDLVLEDDRDWGALLEARRLPGVNHAEAQFVVPCDLRSGPHTKRTSITGIAPDARLTVPHNAAGQRIPPPPTGLLLSNKLAELLDVRPGDEVTITPIRGDRRPRVAPVAQLIDTYVGLAAYADYDYLNRLVGEHAAVSTIQLDTQPGLEARLALFRAVKELPAVQAVNDIRQVKRNLDQTILESMRTSVVLLVLFAGAIYFGSILTTSLVALAERQREVATLIVSGFHKSTVGGIFLRESLIVNVIGALIGLPLGIWLLIVLLEQYDTEVFRMPLVLPATVPLVALIVSIVFTVSAHGLVQRAIARLNWREALNAKE